MNFKAAFEYESLMKSKDTYCTLNSPKALSQTKDNVNRLPPHAMVKSFLVDDYAGCPDNWLRSTSKIASYFVPVQEGHGLWLDFNKNFENDRDVAILISVQGVNPITGLKYTDKLEQYEETCPKCQDELKQNNYCSKCAITWPKQNYISTRATPWGVLWIDGFRTVENVVRQYIFTEEVMRGVAANVIGENRSYAIGVTFFLSKEAKKQQEIYNPRRVAFKASTTSSKDKSDLSSYKKRGVRYTVFPPNSSSSSESFGPAWSSSSIDVSEPHIVASELKGIIGNNLETQFYSPVHTPVNWQIPTNAGEANCANDEDSVSCYASDAKSITRSLEIGAGEKIDQRIYNEKDPLSIWQEDFYSRICINYCTHELADQIISKGIVKKTMKKEGSLEAIPVGN